jgi:proteasome alpha subunit
MGGSAEPIGVAVREGHREGISLTEGVQLAVSALSTSGGEPREILASQLEIAVLDRTRSRRTFRRLPDAQVAPMMPS